jgi:hypothetical protein
MRKNCKFGSFPELTIFAGTKIAGACGDSLANRTATDDGGEGIRIFGFETEAASRHVDARNDVITECFIADASEITDFGAPVGAAFGGSRVHRFGKGFKDYGGGR